MISNGDKGAQRMRDGLLDLIELVPAAVTSWTISHHYHPGRSAGFPSAVQYGHSPSPQDTYYGTSED